MLLDPLGGRGGIIYIINYISSEFNGVVYILYFETSGIVNCVTSAKQNSY